MPRFSLWHHVVLWLRYLAAAGWCAVASRKTSPVFVELAADAGNCHYDSLFWRLMRRTHDAISCDAKAASQIALRCWALGDKGQAERIFQTALAKNPTHPTLIKRYGAYLVAKGDHAQGLALLERGLGEEPHDPWALIYLGGAYRALGRLDDARICCERVIREYGKDWGEAYMGCAFVASDEGQWNEAVGLWLEAIKRLPQSATSWYNLGNTLLNLNRFSEAIPAFEKSLRLGWHERHAALYGIAMAHMELGDSRKAREFCEMSLRESPDYDLALDLMKEFEKPAATSGSHLPTTPPAT